jgi:hypothetical protein
MVEQEEKDDLTQPSSTWKGRRLAYASLLLILSYLLPGCIVLYYVFDKGWDVTAPPFSYDYHIVFSFYRYWTPLSIMLIGSALIFSSILIALWFRRPRWNLHLVAAFSWYSILLGIVYSTWILVFAFILPVGYWFADGPEGGASGYIYGPLIELLISVPVLAAGIYGRLTTSWVKKNPSLAHPSDVRESPNHLSRTGWASAGFAAVVAVTLILTLLNPSLSPLAYIHDRDGDGAADRFDSFPDDPSLWEPTGFWIGVNETQTSFILAIREVYSDNLMPNGNFYVSMIHTDSSVGLNMMPLSDMVSGVTYTGVTFRDNSGIGYIDAGDEFEFDRAIYEERSLFELTSSRGEVHYLQFNLQTTYWSCSPLVQFDL